LTRLASLRAKLIRDIAEYEKVLWVSNVPHERGCFTQAWGRDAEHEPDEWLEVQNHREPELPVVPDQCKEWVSQSALRNKSDLPELLPEITHQVQNPDWREGSDQPETMPRTERLEEHPEIQRAWDRYIEDKWLPWTKEHNAWEKVHKAYSTLFAIHQEQLRLGEEYELVLGLGLLTWQTHTGQRVRRHLIVADAILEFEARLGKFTARPHTEGAKLRPELDMPDIEVEIGKNGQKESKVRVALKGVALFDRKRRTTEYKHADSGYVSAWYLDEDYDGDCFVDGQMFFDFKRKPATSKLGLNVNDDEFALKLTSESFPVRSYKRIAVKVVDVYGNKSTVVRDLG
jgi:hypothetical protein